MTRITGSTIIACPECGKEYRTPACGSINLSGAEEWSDGFVDAGLYDARPAACKCGCGALFLRAKAPRVCFVPRPGRPRAGNAVQMLDIPVVWRSTPRVRTYPHGIMWAAGQRV